jgi:DNA-binding sugar fermentation-stimulating protein
MSLSSTSLGSNSILFNLGIIFRYGVVSRPSISIKSPYVADLIADPYVENDNPFSTLMSQKDTFSTPKLKKEYKSKVDEIAKGVRDDHEVVLGHAPSLDCQGMVGPGTNVWVSEGKNPNSKTKFVIQLCTEGRSDESDVVVGYHPTIAEHAAKAMLEKGLLKEELGEFSEIKSQFTYPVGSGNRYDFMLRLKDGKTMVLLEVKNVVGAEYKLDTVPSTRSSLGTYEVAPNQLPKYLSNDAHKDKLKYQRHALFPHGSKKPIGVVSDRAIKHVHHLSNLNGAVDEDSGLKIKTAMLFVINRSDCAAFRPCHEACLLFSQVLKNAEDKGVNLIAKEIVMTDKTTGGHITESGSDRVDCIVSLGQTLPVCFDSSVKSEDIDEEHVAAVLKFNAEQVSFSPSKKKATSLTSANKKTLIGGEGEEKAKKVARKL